MTRGGIDVSPADGGRAADEPDDLERLARPERRLLAGSAPQVARLLLGLLVVRRGRGGLLAGRIVETEAYAGPEDGASHARAGLTRRTRPMFGPPGHAYVYLVYGLHHCLNVVCAPDGEASAVLIRALEPVAGLDAMLHNRGRPEERPERLAAGPARLCQALDIDRRLDGIDLLGDERLWLAVVGQDRPPSIVSGPRVGVRYAGPRWAARPWRFGLSGHPSLSRPLPAAG
jgi:DNA-3-methyladenine glycosylase